MSIFAEILCKQFPEVQFPSVNNDSIYKLNEAYKYNKIYYNAIKLIYNIYFLPYNKKHNNINNTKFSIFDIVIFHNDEIASDEKAFFLSQFCLAQKTYSAFRKLATIYKYKHATRFELDMDLCFNKFSNLSQNILITLFEKNIIYKFRISDLINIINKCLSNAPYFFSEPLDIRNPYTNLPFSSANLYNIYFTLKTTNYIMPILFHQYFVSNFDLVKFKTENECIIRDKSINQFIKNESIDECYEYIMKMFYVYHTYIYFTLHSQFPKKKVVTTFKKYLKLFLLREYSLNPMIREKCNIELEYKLALFSQLNPEYGKKLWLKKRRNNENQLYYYFNTTVHEMSGFNYTSRSNILNTTEIYNRQDNIECEINIDDTEESEENEEREAEEEREESEASEDATTDATESDDADVNF